MCCGFVAVRAVTRRWRKISRNFPYCASVAPARTDMSVSAGATDAQYGKFLEIFRQRLVTSRTATNPQHIYYFDAGSDSVIGATQFWRADQPVTALGKATFGTQANALREMLVLGHGAPLSHVAGG